MKRVKKSGAQEKRRKIIEERRSKKFTAFIAILLVAITAEAVYIGAGSKYFNIREISVSGSQRLPKDKIIKLSGLSTKDNFLYADTGMAARRIKGDPWIKRATIVRRLPLTIRITVVERDPAALWLNTGLYYLMDADEEVIAAAAAPPQTGLPIIKDCPPEPGLEAGEKAGGSAIRNALAVTAGLDKDIKADIGWISAPTIDGLSIQLNSGPLIMYGKAEMAKQKNYAIKVILTEAVKEEKTWQYIDVRVPSNPVAKAAA